MTTTQTATLMVFLGLSSACASEPAPYSVDAIEQGFEGLVELRTSCATVQPAEFVGVVSVTHIEQFWGAFDDGDIVHDPYAIVTVKVLDQWLGELVDPLLEARVAGGPMTAPRGEMASMHHVASARVGEEFVLLSIPADDGRWVLSNYGAIRPEDGLYTLRTSDGNISGDLPMFRTSIEHAADPELCPVEEPVWPADAGLDEQ